MILILLLACNPLDLLPQSEPEPKHAAPSTPKHKKRDSGGTATPTAPAERADPCADAIASPPVRGCTQGSITCGGSVQGNSATGLRAFDDALYRKWFCTPEPHDYGDAPEAVYTLEVPADILAEVALTSDCVDLDVVAIAWDRSDQCPGTSNAIHECEMDTHAGGGKIRVSTVSKPQTYLLVVDGKDGVTGNYRLDVECRTYR